MTPNEQFIPERRWAFPVSRIVGPYASYEGANPIPKVNETPSYELFEGNEIVLETAEGVIGFVIPEQ